MNVPVSRPAVGSNLAVVALAVGVGALLAGAAGTTTGFAVGVAGGAFVVFGLRVVDPEVTAKLVAGNALVLCGSAVAVGGVGVGATGAIGAHSGVSIATATAVVPVATFGVGAVLYGVLDGVGRDDLREAVYLFGYTWIVLWGALALLLLLNVGVLPVFRDVAGEFVGDSVAAVVAAVTRNGPTRLGTFSVLLSVAYGLLLWNARKRLYRRLAGRLGNWVEEATSRDDDDGSTADEPGSGEGESTPAVGRYLPSWRTVHAVVLAGGTVLGIALLAFGLGEPMGIALSAVVPALGPLGGVLEWVGGGPPADAVIWAVPVLLGARILHAVVGWLLHFPWERYRRRLGRVAVPAVVVAGAFLGSRTVLSIVRDTPGIHYVPSVRGDAVYLTPEGVREFQIPGSNWTGLERSTEAFSVALDGILALVGPTALVLVPVCLVAVLAGLVAFVPYLGGWLLVPRVGTPATVGGTFLFAGTALTALLDVATMRVLLATAGVLGVWKLTETARGLGDQLGESARTGRAEAVHVVGVGAVAVASLGGALALDRLAGVLQGTLASRPEGEGAVVALLAVAAATVGFAALRRAS